MTQVFRFSDYMERDEVRVVIDTVPLVSKHPERDQLLLEVLWQSGARVTEAVGLRPRDIGLTELLLRNLKQYKVVKGADGKPTRGSDGKVKRVLDKDSDKKVEISKELSDRLKKYCLDNKIKSDEYIFKANRGQTPLARWYVWWLLQRIREKSGISKFGKLTKHGRKHSLYPHLFRHSNAMHLLESTGDITIVQSQLGHADIRTTQIYAYAKKPKIRKEVAKIDW